MLPEIAEKDLGKAEIEFAASVTAPLCWVLRDCSGERMKNGSVFFLDTGEATFAVTACHVVEQCLADSKLPTFIQTMIGGRTGHPVPIHLGDRLIDAHRDLDIATFRVTAKELERAGHTVLRGFQKGWPPRLAEVEGGITYCGFPRHARRVRAFHEIIFGIFSGACSFTSSNEESLSVLIEREHLDDQFHESCHIGGFFLGSRIPI